MLFVFNGGVRPSWWCVSRDLLAIDPQGAQEVY
jgi:hypothetical protein